MALELAETLGADRQWCLIGGLMVQLHGHEHNDDLRPTVDIDLLGDARKSPAMTEQMAAPLAERGAEVAMPLVLILGSATGSCSKARSSRSSGRTG